MAGNERPPQCRSPIPRSARSRSYKVADEKGRDLQVTQSGGRLWRLKFRLAGGVEKKLSLGAYPEISLKAARDLRDPAPAPRCVPERASVRKPAPARTERRPGRAPAGRHRPEPPQAREAGAEPRAGVAVKPFDRPGQSTRRLHSSTKSACRGRSASFPARPRRPSASFAPAGPGHAKSPCDRRASGQRLTTGRRRSGWRTGSRRSRRPKASRR